MSDARVSPVSLRSVYVHDWGDYGGTAAHTQVWAKDPASGRSWQLHRQGAYDRGSVRQATGQDEMFLAYGELPDDAAERGIEIYVDHNSDGHAEAHYRVEKHRSRFYLRRLG